MSKMSPLDDRRPGREKVTTPLRSNDHFQEIISDLFLSLTQVLD
jgi:hypothetical protein